MENPGKKGTRTAEKTMCIAHIVARNSLRR